MILYITVTSYCGVYGNFRPLEVVRDLCLSSFIASSLSGQE